MMANRLHAAERIDNLGHVSQDIGELAASLDRLAACLVDNFVGALTPQLRSRRHHHGFSNDKAMRQVKIFPHAPLVNDEPS